MKERPIPFSTDMVRAVLDGRKTQTRRVIKRGCPSVKCVLPKGCRFPECDCREMDWSLDCPYGQPGDRLWVRETFAFASDDITPIYRATDKNADLIKRWKPSIFMPKKLARIWLEIIGVKIERVQDISEEDAIAEGVGDPFDYQLQEYYDQGVFEGELINKCAFAGLWDSLNKKRGYGWEKNPWVWVIGFDLSWAYTERF